MIYSKYIITEILAPKNFIFYTIFSLYENKNENLIVLYNILYILYIIYFNIYIIYIIIYINRVNSTFSFLSLYIEISVKITKMRVPKFKLL